MPDSNGHYDVIIIGTGAGGGTLAHRLAPSGKKVLLIERGDYVQREADNWSTRAVNLEAKYNTKEVWFDRFGKELHPHTNYNVGGNTKFYGAALFRMRRVAPCGTVTAQDAFHRHRWPDRPQLSVNMARADARTVSYSVIEVGPQRIQLAYQDGAPGDAGACTVLELCPQSRVAA